MLYWPLIFIQSVLGLSASPLLWWSLSWEWCCLDDNIIARWAYTFIYIIKLSIIRYLSYLSWLKYPKGKSPLRRHSPCAFYRPGGIIGYKRRKSIILMIAMTSSHVTSTSRMDHGFDTDSFKIKVDNCCSSSFTNNLDDVVGTPVPVKAKVKGFGGSATPVTHRVTIRWNIEDDLGRRHTILLRNSYYAPTGDRLLSPQHWAQVANDNYPTKDGTCCLTTASSIKLMWEQRKNTKTIILDPTSNIGIMRSAPGYKKFQSFCSEVSDCDDDVALTSHLILDDDDDSGQHNGILDMHTHAPTSTQSEKVHVIPPEEHDAKTTRNINYERPTSQREEPIVLDGIDSLP